MVLAHWSPSRVVQCRAPSLNGVHPQLLEVPLNRFAAPGGRWRRATGHTKARKDKLFAIIHWNAESVMNKKTELEHILCEENIKICFILETHLQSNKSFKMRDYQCFRSDRTDGSKGRVLTLVRNSINACLIDTHMEDTKYQVMEIKADAADIQLENFYYPRALSKDIAA